MKDKFVDILVRLVCNEQIRIIKENPSEYASDDYKDLEVLKVALKSTIKE